MDKQRTVNVRGGIAPGYALADRIEALRGAATALNMPATYSTRVSGRGKELEKTFNEFIWAFLLSLIFMYMILASQFESLLHPLTILLSLPLSIPFAFLSLWYTGNTLNLYSALGILVLFGVVKKNSILQIDHTNNLRARGMDRMQAIMTANRDRLRPILMTTLALVAGMLPLAIGTGPGAEERRSIAVVVIGGQSLCLLLTLPGYAGSVFDLRRFWCVLQASRIGAPPTGCSGTRSPRSCRSRSRGGLGSMSWPWRLQQCRTRQGFDIDRQPGDHEIHRLSTSGERLVGSP